MKTITFILTIILFITLGVNYAKAGEFEASIKHFSDTTGSEHFSIDSWHGVEFKYQPSKDSLYYFISQENGTVLMATYPAFEIDFTGIGFGFKKIVSGGVRFYGQLGYYIVDPSDDGRFDCAGNSCGEGLYYGLNNQWAHLHSYGLVSFNEYEIESQDGFGVTFGVEMAHKLTKNIDLVFGAEYRAMYYDIIVSGMSSKFGDYDTNGQRWESRFKGNSSVNYKIGLNYAF